MLDGCAPGSPAFVRPLRPLEAERLAWVNADAARRLLERGARAALREPRGRGGRGPRGAAAGTGGFGPKTEELFDLVAAGEMLPLLVPGGRLPDDFAQRCLRHALARRDVLAIERAALETGARIATAAGAEGSRTTSTRPGARERARLGRLARRYPGEPEEGLSPGELSLPGTRWTVDRRGALHERLRIAGTDIVVGPPLHSGRARLRAARDPGGAARAARRLSLALARVDAAWPEAGAEIRRRTRLVLPLDEPGLVSFSLPARPGVSFINLRSKSIVDLADDLLHETAHHRLHAIERHGTLVTAAARRTDGPRFWSPWRRAPRPLRGLLHAVYTFAFRAELLERMAAQVRAEVSARVRPGYVRAARARSAAALVTEGARERRNLRSALVDLHEAARAGLLTAAGRRLLAPLSAACGPTTSPGGGSASRDRGSRARTRGGTPSGPRPRRSGRVAPRREPS